MANGQPVTLDMSTAQPIAVPGQVKLDMSTAQPIQSSAPPSQTGMDDVAARHARSAPAGVNYGSSEDTGILSNLATGVAKGAATTIQGAANLAGGRKLVNEGMLGDTDTAPQGVSQDIGEGVENIGEFAMGDLGLEGLAKAAKITEMAGKYPLIAKTLAMAKEHPVIAKILGETVKGATTGGAQGVVKGEAEGKAKEGLEGGALGGGIGGGAGAAIESAVTPLAEAVAQKAGIGTSATKDAVMGARPGKRNYRFAEDFLRAAPRIDDVEAQFAKMGDPAKNVEDWADRAGAAREIVYKNKIQPLINDHPNEVLGNQNIVNGATKEIPDAMREYSPDEAAKMEQIISQFQPGGKVIPLQKAEDAIQHFNAELSKTGYWSRMPQEREDLLKTDGTIAGYKAIADSLRDEFYGRLKQLNPGSDIAELKKDYGALANVENEFRGRVNVNDRQAPISLKETIGLITGMGTGGVGGAAIAALPFVDRMVNSPERMIGRAVQKAARPGEEGIAAKAVQGAGRAAKKANQTLAAPVGSGLGRIIFTASDGSTHSIPDDHQALAHARTIDPGLKIVQ